MRWSCVGSRIAALSLACVFAVGLAGSLSAMVLQKNGTLAVGGHTLRCGSMRNVLDPRLPGLGLAAPGVVVFNPRLINQQSSTVRLFVFYHECGHHHVGGSETGADCWAVKQGVRQGWLSRDSLGQICRSFGNGPATSTHPSGASRCASLQQCFASVAGVQAKRSKTTASARNGAPKLVAGPALVRNGKEPSAE
jgi:hypothetical protein